MGENGLIRQAEKAGEHHANGVALEQDAIDTLLDKYLNGISGEENNGSGEETERPTTGPNGKPLTSTVKVTNHTGTAAEDILGNSVYIPGGFKIASDSGETVKEGIVVEDTLGNQFVWIPVSNIDGSQSNPIKIDETNSVVITLGRYIFDVGTRDSATNLYNGTGAVSTTAGTYQYAVNYATTVTLNSRYQELKTKISGKNEIAKNLVTFIESVRDNHGYYLARYEAGIVNVDTDGNPVENYSLTTKVATDGSIKPLSQYGKGLWNSINQADASYVCKNMYAPTATVESYTENSYVESDLINSYAWDTAIVYIQAMTNTAYACANSYSIGNTSSKLNTGESDDQKCKIYDMAANIYEWTTEYSTLTNSNGDFPCTYRGGYNGMANYTANRYSEGVGVTVGHIGFRVILYCKIGE